jgi:uncharacterized hydrophobic protein (TIGR00271 family)
MMSTMVVVTQAESATAVVRWAARFAKMRNDSLTVLCCLSGQPIMPSAPVNLDQPENNEELIQTAAKASREIKDQEVQLFFIRHPKPAKAIIQEIQTKNINFLCTGIDTSLPKDSPVNRLAVRLLRFAPCDIFVLDPGDGDGSRYRNIILPMGSGLKPFTMQTAVQLAEKLDCTVRPFEVGSYFGKDSKEVAQHSLISKLREAGIKESKSIQPIVALSGERWKSAVNRSRGSDLVLTSAAVVREVRRFRQEEKNHTEPGSPRVPIGLMRPWNLESKSSLIGMIESHIFSWLPRLAAVDRIDLFDRLQAGARWNVDYILMMCLSTAIASLGLIQNSTAVIIGAMVVAPLMTPLIGAGLSLVQGNLVFFRDAMRAMGFGITASLIISIFLGFIVPFEELSPELLARGAPTVIDLAVAFLSGAAAAYALARPSLLGALAGVAIAAALVPPLATVGIAFSEFRWDIVEGAAILFVTNLVAIILGAAFVYRLLGIQGSRIGVRLPLWVRRTVLLLVLLSVALTAPLGYKLADQLLEGQTRPYTLPVSKVVWKAIRDRVHQEHGVTFLSASRFGIEHDIDMVILLVASKPVSAGFISSLKRVANRAHEDNLNVGVYVFQEAEIKRSEF